MKEEKSVWVYPLREPLDARVSAPPSKSYTHRALIATAYSVGETRIVNPLISRDTLATVSLVRALGSSVSREEGGVPELRVRGRGVRTRRPWCNCRGSGTTLRLGMGVASLSEKVFTLFGNASLNRRPVEPLARALRGIGVEAVVSGGGTPPVAVRGPPSSDAEQAVVEGSVSSQFVSSLLMLGARVGFETRVRGRLRSRPYVDLTLRVLEAYGVAYRERVEGGDRVFTPEGEYRPPPVFRVPGDYSSAAFLLAAGALAGRVRVTGLDREDVQGDKLIVELLTMMGATIKSSGDWVEVGKADSLTPLDVFMGDTPDLVPIMSVMAAYAQGESRLRGVGHLRYKESDRLSNIVENLRSLGVTARVEEGETLVVQGRGSVRGGRVDSRCDHRIVMSFAVAALAAEGPIKITCPESVAESFPGFFDVLRDMGVRVEWG